MLPSATEPCSFAYAPEPTATASTPVALELLPRANDPPLAAVVLVPAARELVAPAVAVSPIAIAPAPVAVALFTNAKEPPLLTVPSWIAA